MPFDPSQLGATPVTSSPSTSFNPSDYGATPVHTPSPFSQGTDLETMAAKVPASQDMVKNFFSSLGQGVKGTAKALTDPIVGGAKEVANDTSQAFQGGVSQVKQGASELGQAGKTGDIIGPTLKMGAGVVNSALSPLAAPFKPVSFALESATGPNNYASLANLTPLQNFANSKAGNVTSQALEPIANAGTIAQGALVGAGASEAIDKGVNALNTGVEKIAPGEGSLVDRTVPTIAKGIEKAGQAVDKLTQPSPVNEAKVNDLYNRAIKPTVVGKSNAGQVAKANSQVVSGLKAISENKANLNFTDANGETITGQAPKSVDQLNQAIEQTKSAIFKQYDALAKQAGEKGVTVDASKISNELSPVINSKSLAIANPKAVEYAKAAQERLSEAGGIDAQTAQEVIQHYNESLKAFYKNPSYDSASTASIDALIANKFRAALDEGISGATGEQYQALKNQYGALSSMEKDVTHRNIVWGRQNSVGLAGNIANVASGAELVRGLLNMNPVSWATGTAIKGIQLYMKYLNNPDVGVSKIFSELEKPSPAATASTKPPVNTSTK
jgi:hypothetical protein